MVTNEGVAIAFVNGNKAKAGNMYTDGQSVWSYGSHFCIATKMKNCIAYCDDKYSNTTSGHQCRVRHALQSKYNDEEIIRVSQSEMQKIVHNKPENVVILTRTELSNNEDDGFAILKNAWKRFVLFHRFPEPKLRKVFEDELKEKMKKQEKSILGKVVFQLESYTGNCVKREIIIRKKTDGTIAGYREGEMKGRSLKDLYRAYGVENITAKTIPEELHKKIVREITLDKI